MDFIKKHNSLKDYTDRELYEDLINNESLDAKYLVWICSEVLRRIMEKQFN